MITKTCTLLACLSLPTVALGASTLHYDGAGMSQFAVSANALRGDQGDTSVLYRADEDVLYVIDNVKREYTRMGAQEIAQLTETMQGAMRQMEQAMAQIPPEQRQMVESMMRKQMGGAVLPQIELVAIGSSSAGGYDCQQYETRINGRATQRSCVVDPQTLGLSGAEAATIAAFQQRMSALAKGMGEAIGSSGFAFPEGAMVPVQLEDLNGDDDALLSSVSSGADEASFELPSGYRERKLELPGR